MSETSKGDTSSSLAALPLSTRVVKNPLLSASVTGLTFDDFQNKPLLLPAAPPIVHPSPVVSSRESTPLVTVGKSSEIDSEGLSEINLNDTSVTASSNTAETSDENSNSLLESASQIDNSILSQAATSFSQLPSVASSVFSTFSKKFNSSGRDDYNSNLNPQLNIQPFSSQYISQVEPQSILPPASGFVNQDHRQTSIPQCEPQQPVEPPTFYSPTDTPAIPSVPNSSLPAAGQNNYRLSARKKIYAPIPGLSAKHQEQQTFPTPAFGNYPPPSSSPVNYSTQINADQTQERKSGLFSFSNLVPAVPSVLQNLSGLVQTATGASQKIQEPLQQYPNQGSAAQHPLIVTESTQNIQEQSQQYPPPNFAAQRPPTLFYPAANQLSQQATVTAGFSALETDKQNLHFGQEFIPEQQGAQRKSSFSSTTSDQNITSTTAPQFFSTSVNPPKNIENVKSKSSENLFQTFPSSVPPPTFPTLQPTSSAQLPSTEVLFANASSKGVKPDVKTLTFENTTTYVPTPTNIPFSEPSSNNNLSGHIPTFAPQDISSVPPQAKPPSAGPAPSSFRLQKGTRLYKSPFATATSEHQQQPTILQNTNPNTKNLPEVFNPFNPQGVLPQQGIVPSNENLPPSQGVLQPLGFDEPQGVTPPFQGIIAKESNVPPPHITPPLQTTVLQQEKVTPQEFSLFKSGPPIPTALTSQVDLFTPITNSQIPTALTSKVNLFTPTQETQNKSEPSIEKTTVLQSSEHERSTPENPKVPDFTIEPLNESETKSFEKQQITKLNENLSKEQPNPLPPPPVATLLNVTSSTETANFPPPPPQHSFQNKHVSNPYRKGLQGHHPPVLGPTSLSTFFNPIQQDIDLNQPIEQEANNNPLLPEQENPKITDQKVEKTSNIAEEQRSSLEKNPPTGPLQSISPLLSTTPSTINQPGASGETESVTVSSFFTNLSESSTNNVSNQTDSEKITEEKRSSPKPPINFVNFFKSDSDSSVIQKESEEKEVTPVTSSVPAAISKIDPPLKSQEDSLSEPSAPNLLTNFFDQSVTSTVTPVVVPQQPSLPDPTSFFDSFNLVPSLGVSAPPPEDPNSQRIQNFFNNPPPKELDTVGDLNYNLVGAGLSVQNLQKRSLTPASNLAEPPSSSCSDFSELNSSLSAANRQQQLQAADSNKVSPEEEATFDGSDYQDLPQEIVNEIKMANTLMGNTSPTSMAYTPAVKHWFYKRKRDSKFIWTPFSHHDSALLEDAFLKGGAGSNLVAVEGGRFDVNISERIKTPVYWEGEPIEVKRCSWFFKASDSKYVPYEEELADVLEEEYRKASESSEWHKKIPISASDVVVFHGPTVIVHFQPQQQVDSWGGSTQTITRPRVVKRDLDDFTIEEGESHKVDHLLFMVHGIGSACDLKMRSVEEVVDEFRSIALQLVQSHYKNSVENGYVGRVEVLPVSWHNELHSDELGIDEKLKSITLESIPKLRNFTNDTLLDILFYTSPVFCQRIINTVTASMNKVFIKYKQRNPEFNGGVSLAGHSLGSLIMFDLLCHQRPHQENEEKNMENPDEISSGYSVDSNQLNENAGENITYKMGQAGTGQPFISYPQLLFAPKQFFALGSPIGMFVTIRGIDKLGLDFRLPTCPGFYNIFHPYDPVAYRIEALVNPDLSGISPVLIPHHKGRKRMHLELKETMSRVGADLKQRFFGTFKNTLDNVSFLAPLMKNDSKEIEKEVDKAQQDQVAQQSTSSSRSRANSSSTTQSDTDIIEIDFPLGKLNDSKRVDYVLQEAPLEFFNEYLFALSSHVCYWESEDTILFVMKQIYSGLGFSPDSQVPQQTLTIERPSSSGSATQQNH